MPRVRYTSIIFRMFTPEMAIIPAMAEPMIPSLGTRMMFSNMFSEAMSTPFIISSFWCFVMSSMNPLDPTAALTNWPMARNISTYFACVYSFPNIESICSEKTIIQMVKGSVSITIHLVMSAYIFASVFLSPV